MQNLFVFWFSFNKGSLPWINNCPSVIGGLRGIDKEGAEKSVFLGIWWIWCSGRLRAQPLVFKHSWRSLLSWCFAALPLPVCVFTWFGDFLENCPAVLGSADSSVIPKGLTNAGEGVKRLTPFYPSFAISLHSEHWHFILCSTRFFRSFNWKH